MDTPTIISLLSLLVACLALPTSYWVAVRQVRVGLEEHDRRAKERARVLAADAIEEFFQVFYTAAEEIAHVQPQRLRAQPALVDPHIAEIDVFVSKTGVLDRVAAAIDRVLEADGVRGLPQEQELTNRLQSIRGQVALGSNPGRSATLGVISAVGGVDLRAFLRGAK